MTHGKATRILCVWLPRWPIQRLRHAQPGLRKRALVLYTRGLTPHGSPRTGAAKMQVTACSAQAARAGVVPGMPLAEARALALDALFAPHEPEADLQALRKMARWCHRFSPVVAVEEAAQPESLLLDITGCGPLFGGEKALAAKLLAELRRYGYQASAAIADTIGAAWAVAHYGQKTEDRRQRTEDRRQRTEEPTFCPLSSVLCPLSSVPSGNQADALRPLPVEALRLSGPVLQLLHQFDINRIGQLLALPRADFPSRLGREVLFRMDQALGKVPELLNAEVLAEPVEASWLFEPAITDRWRMEAVLEHLLGQILDRLRPWQRGLQQFCCWLQTPLGTTIPVPVSLLQPSASLEHLMGLVRLHLERLRVPEEVSSLIVRAQHIVPLEALQQDLFTEPAFPEKRQQFSVLIERLSNRLGEKAVLRPQLWPDAQPEYACRFEPWLQRAEGPSGDQRRAERRKPSGEPTSRPRKSRLPDGTCFSVPSGRRDLLPARKEGRLLRPPCLKSQPIALAVSTLFPGGPPLRFQWQNQQHHVAHCWGPERIETGWWRGRDVRRDYYLVETTNGQRFWLFRTKGEESWFLHGIFA